VGEKLTGGKKINKRGRAERGREVERLREREGRVKPHRYSQEGGDTDSGTHQQLLQE